MSMSPPPSPSSPVRGALAVERAARLDPAVTVFRRLTRPLQASRAGSVLRGSWLGQPLHPTLTDIPLGMWTAASVLDLASVLGDLDSRPAAQRLVGVGLLSAVPTALTGWADWTGIAPAQQRVGVVHAGLNVTAVGLYAGSWAARRRGRHGTGAALALGGAAISTVARYLGTHLASVRAAAGQQRPGAGSASPGSTQPPQVRTKRSGGLTSGGALAAAGTDGKDELRSAIVAQHAKIQSLAETVSLGPAARRGPALAQLLAHLAGYEAVKQELLVPLGARFDPERPLPEGEMTLQISRLEKLDIQSPSFGTQFGLFEDALGRHAGTEEEEQLPRLLHAIDDEQARTIVRVLAAEDEAAARRSGSFDQMLASARVHVRSLAGSA
jgi:uncharacterized membrane protein